MICKKLNNIFRPAICVLSLCGLLSNSVVAQELDPKVLIKRMSDEIAGLQNFIINGDAYSDARLEAGLIIEHATQATMRVQKPGKVRITNKTSEDVKELFFDSGSLTVFTQSKNFYAEVEVPGGTGAALDQAVNEFGIDVPMLDFVSGNVAERMLADATDVMYFGPSLIRGGEYEHVVIRTPEIDVQLWIAAEGKPLPGKMSLSAKWDTGSPRTVVFMDWDTSPDFSGKAIQFDPPEGAERIMFESQLDQGEK